MLNSLLLPVGVDTVLALSYYPPKTVIKYRALPHVRYFDVYCLNVYRLIYRLFEYMFVPILLE